MFSDEEIKGLPAKVSHFVQDLLKKELESLKSSLGCACLKPNIIMALIKLLKAVRGLPSAFEKLNSAAQDGGQSELGKSVTFAKDVIDDVFKTMSDVVTAVKDFFASVGSTIAEDVKETITMIADVLFEFVKLLQGGGFVVGLPKLSSFANLGNLIPEALKNCGAKVFEFLMGCADAAVSKYGVIGAAFLALVKPAEMAGGKGLERLKGMLTNQDPECVGASMLGLLIIGLRSKEHREDAKQAFQSVVSGSGSAETKAEATSAIGLIMAEEAADKAAALAAGVMSHIPGAGAVSELAGGVEGLAKLL